MRRFLIILILLLAAFLAGYGPLYFENRRLQESWQQTRGNLQAELSQANLRLQLCGLQGELGLILVEVHESNYGKARAHSTDFFDHLQQTAFTAEDDGLKRRLMAFLERRDEITADLTSLNPESPMKVRKLYQEFFETLRRHTSTA